MATNYVDSISNASRHVKGVARSLEFMARAFAEVGNDTVSIKLIHMAEELFDALLRIDGAVDAKLDEDLVAARGTSKALLDLALSGALGSK